MGNNKVNNNKENKTKLIKESNSIEKSLKRYIVSRDEFAFLLNGPWGSGKTFFINNFLNDIDGKYSTTYFSLNDVGTVNNLYSEILYKICIGPGRFSNIKEFTNEVFKDGNSDKLLGKLSFVPKLANSVAISSMEKIIYSKKNRIVLVLDDLERFLNQNSVDINEFVGVITRLLNQDIKIVIIADETKISNVKFYEVREKIINKTINYLDYNSGSAIEIIESELESIFENYENNDVKNKFYDWIEKFYSYIKNEKQINLRMIKSVMFSFDEIVQESKNDNYKADLLEVLLENAFISIYIYTNIYWYSMSKLEFNDVESFIGKRIRQLKGKVNDDNQKSKTNFDSRLNNFILNITDDLIKDKFLLTKEIFTLVTKDELNFSEYAKYIDLMLLFNISGQDKKNQENINKNNIINNLINKLNDVSAKSEDELKELENDAIDYIKNDELAFTKKLALYDSLYGLYLDDLYLSKKDFDGLTNLMKKYVSSLNFKNYELKDGINLIKSYIKLISNAKFLKEEFKIKLSYDYKHYCNYIINLIKENELPDSVIYIPFKILYEEINNYDHLIDEIVNDTEFGYRLVKYINYNNDIDFQHSGVIIRKLSLDFYKKISCYNLEDISDKLKRYKYNLFKIKCKETIDQLERNLTSH